MFPCWFVCSDIFVYLIIRSVRRQQTNSRNKPKWYLLSEKTAAKTLRIHW